MSLTNIETEAFVVAEPKAPFKLTPISLDEVREKEILVEMKYSGICHTDIVVQQGLLQHLTEYPVVLGHEGAGIIRAIGSNVRDKSLKVGDQVLLSYTTCQSCGPCLEDRPTFCRTHTEINFNAVRVDDKSTPARLADGKTTVRSQFFGQSSFARLSVVQDFSVVKCPVEDMLPYYAPLGCGFQTGAGTVLEAVKPTKSSRVVVFGLGSVGIAALMAAVHLEVKQIIGVDIVDSRLELVKELGATDVINCITEGDNLVNRLREITEGGADVTIDCSGSPSALQAAVDCLGHGGQAISVGVPPPGVKIDIETQSFFMAHKSYRSVIEGEVNPTKFIPELIELHRKGRFPVDKLCKVYSIKDFDQAVKDMHDGKVIKPIIKWD
ncbi:alcohol [Diaporthe amygdali]|uniref:alcohol n=1 Tax=Phomopsis amygdali TaxID=1214568 RepID=UPI0022FE096F|nr:alcohol [Diaporthe amygdali]KAJ0119742.1 alcohol [Diaporthe amygdali]